MECPCFEATSVTDMADLLQMGRGGSSGWWFICYAFRKKIPQMMHSFLTQREVQEPPNFYFFRFLGQFCWYQWVHVSSDVLHIQADDSIPTVTVKVFSNQKKTMVDKTIHKGLKAHTLQRTTNVFVTLETKVLKAQKKRWKQPRGSTGTKWKFNRRRMWQVLWTITDYRGQTHTLADIDSSLVEDLYTLEGQ